MLNKFVIVEIYIYNLSSFAQWFLKRFFLCVLIIKFNFNFNLICYRDPRLLSFDIKVSVGEHKAGKKLLNEENKVKTKIIINCDHETNFKKLSSDKTHKEDQKSVNKATHGNLLDCSQK